MVVMGVMSMVMERELSGIWNKLNFFSQRPAVMVVIIITIIIFNPLKPELNPSRNAA
jgi:hypothetical protein